MADSVIQQDAPYARSSDQTIAKTAAAIVHFVDCLLNVMVVSTLCWNSLDLQIKYGDDLRCVPGKV